MSSGAPPAAIAVVRISGSGASATLAALAGSLPVPRQAALVRLTDPADGLLLDRALVLWFPGPASATGEDIAELHLHGGRAVIAAVEQAIGALPGLRRAEPGEFTRRAFANGRIDLAEAEGLADLLSAETELQRRSALAMATGGLSRVAEGWRERLLTLSASIEAELDFSDEEDARDATGLIASTCAELAAELEAWLARPLVEPLREGFRIILAGPPNAGKSTLFNALTCSEAAITSPIAGTTRDVITRSVAVEGVPLTFVDTAGLRATTSDAIEAIGIARARAAAAVADVVLWLGDEGAMGDAPCVLEVDAKADLAERTPKSGGARKVAAISGEGVDVLRAELVRLARSKFPAPGETALNKRQHGLLDACCKSVGYAAGERDLLLAAEHLRVARGALDRLVGRSGTEDLLDTLFGRFCIGK